MRARPAWEILVGSTSVLDSLADVEESSPHPLQELVEEFVETQLDEADLELFLMRYGEQLPIRTIARRLGYNSHLVIQIQLKRIEDKAKEWIESKLS